MPKRSITDDEIALIKALLARNTRNRDIQFLFNRPDRAVNTGRITGIRDGSYSDSTKIAPADDATLDAFLASKKATVAEDVAVAIPAAAEVEPSGPLSKTTLGSLFVRGKDKVWWPAPADGSVLNVSGSSAFGPANAVWATMRTSA